MTPQQTQQIQDSIVHNAPIIAAGSGGIMLWFDQHAAGILAMVALVTGVFNLGFWVYKHIRTNK